MNFEVRISKRLGAFAIDVAFASDAGITALFGPSGVGKTSVLNMIAGVIRPSAGHIAVRDQVLFDAKARIDLPPERRRAGYIFQDGRLFPHLTVKQNLLYGWNLTPAENRVLSISDAIAFLGIGHLLGRWPRTLSGGEAQRVSIGRTLLSGPRFLLMDEPLTSLDQERKNEIIAIIERLRDELSLPILYVSHDRAELERLGAQIVVLGGKDASSATMQSHREETRRSARPT